MADYGYYRKKARQRASKNVVLLKIADMVVLVLSSVCSFALILSYISKYVNPNDAWIFAFTGLVFPALYIAEIILLLYWIMRWKKYYMAALAVVLIAGITNAGLYYRPSVALNNDSKPNKNDIVVTSYNVMGFYYQEQKGVAEKNIGNYVNSLNTDILCLQEYPAGRSNGHYMDSLMRANALKYRYMENYKDAKSAGGIAIYSRYPIIRHGSISNNDRVYSIWTDVKIKRDTVRVVNLHLQSTNIKVEDMDFISTAGIPTDSVSQKRVRGIAGRLNRAYKKRAHQADAVADLVRKSPYRTIVCGDFNDTPVSYTYNTIRGDMEDAFVEYGRGSVITYNSSLNVFRIDNIFASDGIKINSYHTLEKPYSDHNPVSAGFEIVELQ